MDNKSVGLILFMSKQADADLIRYTYYQKNILIPFVTRLGEEYDNYYGGEIPDKRTASSWCDGDIKQV